MSNVRIYPDTTHKTRLSSQAQEFRAAYQIANSTAHSVRTRQRNLITEEFKEFLEAEGMLFRLGTRFKPAPSPFSSEELDYGGVQGVFGGRGPTVFN